MSVGLIILNWNGKADTLQCLKSLPQFQGETIVVDNGSSDDSAQAIRSSFPNITLIETGRNLGYAGGNNPGIEHALKKGHEFIFLLNNDTVVDPRIMEAFLSDAAKFPEAGIFGARPCRFAEPEKLDHLGGKWNPEKGWFDLIGLGEPADFVYEQELDYACGCSLFIRRKVFETIGLLEPRYFLFWEEADFCMHAKKAGFHIRICDGAKLLHKVSASFVGGSVHKTYFVWRSRFLWIRRNLSGKEKRKVLRKVILRDIWRSHKHLFLKSLQISAQKLFLRSKNLREQELKRLQYRARTAALKDYLKGEFGKGPDWIYRKF